MNKNFVVRTKKGRAFYTPAEDFSDAIERYWDMIDNTIAHIEKRCTCFNKDHIPIDRSKYDQPIDVIEY